MNGIGECAKSREVVVIYFVLWFLYGLLFSVYAHREVLPFPKQALIVSLFLFFLSFSFRLIYGAPSLMLHSLNSYSLGRDIPQQQNESDCGTFTCTFATYETDTLIRGGSVMGLPLNFSQSDMPYFRKRLAHDILNAKID